jgi:hypothetical protein
MLIINPPHLHLHCHQQYQYHFIATNLKFIRDHSYGGEGILHIALDVIHSNSNGLCTHFHIHTHSTTCAIYFIKMKCKNKKKYPTNS